MQYLAEEHVLEGLKGEISRSARIVALECLVEVREGSLEVFLVSRMKDSRLHVEGSLTIKI